MTAIADPVTVSIDHVVTDDGEACWHEARARNHYVDLTVELDPEGDEDLHAHILSNSAGVSAADLRLAVSYAVEAIEIARSDLHGHTDPSCGLPASSEIVVDAGADPNSGPSIDLLLRRLHTPRDEVAEQYHGQHDDQLDGPCPDADRLGCPGHEVTIQVCQECGHDSNGDWAIFREWPCPTIRILDGDEPGWILEEQETVA